MNKWYRDGGAAFREGKSIDDCPHIGVTARFEWRRGWHAAELQSKTKK